MSFGTASDTIQEISAPSKRTRYLGETTVRMVTQELFLRFLANVLDAIWTFFRSRSNIFSRIAPDSFRSRAYVFWYRFGHNTENFDPVPYLRTLFVNYSANYSVCSLFRFYRRRFRFAPTTSVCTPTTMARGGSRSRRGTPSTPTMPSGTPRTSRAAPTPPPNLPPPPPSPTPAPATTDAQLNA
jgi:hypothetical protein